MNETRRAAVNSMTLANKEDRDAMMSTTPTMKPSKREKAPSHRLPATCMSQTKKKSKKWAKNCNSEEGYKPYMFNYFVLCISPHPTHIALPLKKRRADIDADNAKLKRRHQLPNSGGEFAIAFRRQ